MTGTNPVAASNEGPGRLSDSELDDLAADLDELALVAAGFPAFQFWRAITYDRIRYVAQGTSLDTHPSVVVTHDLVELRAVLGADR
jgi:hypothetical protein